MEIVPKTYFRKIESVDGLYEIRVEFAGNIYRIFCCNDEGQLVILFNGFQKKTQKAPQKEILRAQQIMNEYFQQKETAK